MASIGCSSSFPWRYRPHCRFAAGIGKCGGSVYLRREKDSYSGVHAAVVLGGAKAETDIKRLPESAIKLHLQEGAVQLQVYDDNGQEENSRELTVSLHLPCGQNNHFPGDLSFAGGEVFVHCRNKLLFGRFPPWQPLPADEALYDALQNERVQQAMISAGYNNSYGHPHQESIAVVAAKADWLAAHRLARAILLQADDKKGLRCMMAGDSKNDDKKPVG